MAPKFIRTLLSMPKKSKSKKAAAAATSVSSAPVPAPANPPPALSCIELEDRPEAAEDLDAFNLRTLERNHKVKVERLTALCEQRGERARFWYGRAQGFRCRLAECEAHNEKMEEEEEGMLDEKERAEREDLENDLGVIRKSTHSFINLHPLFY